LNKNCLLHESCHAVNSRDNVNQNGAYTNKTINDDNYLQVNSKIWVPRIEKNNERPNNISWTVSVANNKVKLEKKYRYAYKWVHCYL